MDEASEKIKKAFEDNFKIKKEEDKKADKTKATYFYILVIAAFIASIVNISLTFYNYKKVTTINNIPKIVVVESRG